MWWENGVLWAFQGVEGGQGKDIIVLVGMELAKSCHQLSLVLHSFISTVCFVLLYTVTCDPSLWTSSFLLLLISKLSSPSFLAWSVVSLQCFSCWPHRSQQVRWVATCRCWWSSFWARQSSEFLTSCSSLTLCEANLGVSPLPTY